jgi:hypothetical protein
VDRECRQIRRAIRKLRVIQRADFPIQDPDRPAVYRDVMRAPQQHVLVSGSPQNPDAKQRACRQIEGGLERTPKRVSDGRRALGRRQIAYVVEGNGDGPRLLDDLCRFTREIDEPRSQRFLSCDDGTDRGLQRIEN